MWTVVWIDKDDVDHYVRCDFPEGVKQLLDENNLGDDINVLIFPPETEMEVNEFMEKHKDD
jgi:hypothetical protein